MLAQVLERVEKLYCKSADESQRKPLEVVELEKFIEIDTHELKAYAKVLAKHHVVLHVDNVHGVFGVVVAQVLKNLKFDAGLVVVFLFVLYNLERHFTLALVVEGLHGNPKRTLPEESHDLVAVSNLVPHCDSHIALRIVEAEIEVLFV